MKITFLAPSPKAGQTENIENKRGQSLIDAGFAVEVPLPPRGSQSWLAARNEQEAERQKNIPADKRDNRPTGTTWGTRFLTLSQKHVVVKQSLVGEFTYAANVVMDRGRPDVKTSQKEFVAMLSREGCPKAVIQQYLDAVNAPDYLAAEANRIESDKQAAERQRQREADVPKFL
jgi:hypothetical protein